MKVFCLFIFCVLPFLGVFAQSPADSAHLEAFMKHSRRAPFWVNRSPKRLTRYLIRDARTDEEKVYAISNWMVNNITYDHKAFFFKNTGFQGAKWTLHRRKAVCRGYANLFEAMAGEAGLESEQVTGYSKGAGYDPEVPFYYSNHVWNAVKVDSAWRLVDATWNQGTLIRKKQPVSRLLWKWFSKPYRPRYKRVVHFSMDKVFNDPEEFVQHHLPVHPAWQLLSCPVSMETYEKGPNAIRLHLQYNKGVRCVDYHAQINELHALDEAEKKMEYARHGSKFNPRNHIVWAYAYREKAVTLLEHYNDKAPLEEQVEALEEIKEYSSAGQKSFRAFAGDNKAVHRHVNKSLYRHHQLIYVPAKSRFKRQKKSIGYHQRLANSKDQTNGKLLVRKNKVRIRPDSTVLVASTASNSPLQQNILVKLNARRVLNQHFKSIDSLWTLQAVLADSIQLEQQRMEQLADSVVTLLDTCGRLMIYNALINFYWWAPTDTLLPLVANVDSFYSQFKEESALIRSYERSVIRKIEGRETACLRQIAEHSKAGKNLLEEGNCYGLRKEERQELYYRLDVEQQKVKAVQKSNYDRKVAFNAGRMEWLILREKKQTFLLGALGLEEGVQFFRNRIEHKMENNRVSSFHRFSRRQEREMSRISSKCRRGIRKLKREIAAEKRKAKRNG